MNIIRDRWMFVPIILLGGSVAVGVTTVCLAVVGRPIGAEPEYYNKAAAWDEHRAQSAANDLIGWKVSSQIAPGEDGLPMLTVGITDKYAYAIDPQSVEVEASRKQQRDDEQVEHDGLYPCARDKWIRKT